MPTTADQLDHAKQTVLIIDDALDVHRLLKARLRAEGVEFLSAMSGPEGLAIAQSTPPSLIFLDLDMPGMDGFEVLRKIKANHDFAEIPVLILSARTSATDKVMAFDLGAFDYISKPFTLIELAARMRSALRLHRMVTTLARRANIDGLTLIGNRAFFDRRWVEEYSRAARNPRPLSVALLDIDHFKSINDNFGHPAGDSVLHELASLVSREIRTSDIICRYGGEEFALIMPDTPPQAAASLCERLRASIQAVNWPRHPERNITASFGVAGCSAIPQLTSESWVETADRNLYQAKREGRNRVVSTEIPSAPQPAPTTASQPQAKAEGQSEIKSDLSDNARLAG
jgi:diguanylate cyclase (GGDEF)-like protein